jgi:hypothetical protein
MKAHIQLTTKQCREVNELLKNAYSKGMDAGVFFVLASLHDVYDWTGEPICKVMEQAQKFMQESLKDPDMIDRLKIMLKGAGVKAEGQLALTAPQYGEK